MPAIFEHEIRVCETDIDELGHANNVVYVGWMLSAALAHSAAQGWPAEAYHRHGAGFVVRSHQIEYLRPAFAGEQIVVRTWVAEMKRVTSLRRFRMLRRSDGAVIATAETNFAFIRFATGQPTRIPPEVANAFEVTDG